MNDPIQRYLTEQILEDLNEKMVFVSGPRQIGKTTIAQSIMKKIGGDYLNWDYPAHRKMILQNHIPSESFIIFDEIHKFRNWRNYLKGIYDVHRHELKILVTGSARLDLYRRGGDSLQGRYHMLRMNPLSVGELKITSNQDFNSLLMLGGFPEPFFSGSKTKAQRWSESYRQRLVYDDIRDLERVVDLSKLEQLIFRLPEIVGNPFSINSLREDLNASHKGISHWVHILEKLFFIFRVSPFGSPKIHALKKEPKVYLYDWSLVENQGYQFENCVAVHLLKWIQYRQDIFGERYDLRYFRDVDKKEVDFIVLLKEKPIMAIECKLSDASVSGTLVYFKKRFPQVRAIQVCNNLKKEFKTSDGIEVVEAIHFLNTLI